MIKTGTPVVSKLKSEGYSTIYFSTGYVSAKTRHFKENPKSSVCYYSGTDSVALIGNIEIIEDKTLKHEVWQDWLFDHFPGGPDGEEYCLMKFTAIEASIWIDWEFVPVQKL